MNRAERTIQRIALSLAWGFSLLITTLPPAAYFLVSYQHLRSELLVQAELSANDVNDLVNSNPTLWRYEDIRLSEMLKRRSKDTGAGSIILLDTDGKIIAQSSSTTKAPHMHQVNNIFDSGSAVAQIHISRSLSPVILKTSMVALCSFAIAVAIFFTIRILPMRSIRKAYQALGENEKKYRSLHETMKEGMALHHITFDDNGELASLSILDANLSCAEMFDCDRLEIVGQDSLILFGSAFRKHISEMLHQLEHNDSFSFELTLPDRDSFYNTTVFSLNPGFLTTLFEDITVQRKSERQVKKLAYSDLLTGLPNRALLIDRLKQAVAQASQTSSNLAVFSIDLDRFQIFNDTLGRATGDQLLIQVCQRLHHQIRSSDTLARMGGDEFCIVATNLGEELDASHIAQKLANAIMPPFLINGNELHVTISIGISVFPDDGKDGESLMKSADMAMHAAKDAGRNTYNFYSPEMNRTAHIRMELEAGMRNGLERGEFFLEFQPIMDAETQTLVAAEALVRWNHPTRGRIPPNDFIPMAEETGLILPLGEWVMRTTCNCMKAWNNLALPPIRFSVNVSSKQIEQQDFAEIVRNILLETGANAAQLEIELTESCLVNHAGPNIAEVFGLRDWGISIALDDFGTGYSSLGYIKTLQIDHIKIDRSFIIDINTNFHDQAIVEAIIAMSQKLGIQNVAEGVETIEQLNFLRKHGCREIQGYYFHRPLSCDAFEALMKEQVILQSGYYPSGQSTSQTPTADCLAPGI